MLSTKGLETGAVNSHSHDKAAMAPVCFLVATQEKFSAINYRHKSHLKTSLALKSREMCVVAGT